MPDFKYTAIDRNGQQANGKIDAASAEEARKKLMAKGLMVTAVTGDAPSAKPAPTPGAKPAK